VSQGCSPASGSADWGPRYTLPAGDGSPVSGCTLSLLPRRPHSPADARSDLRLQPPGARSASVDRSGHGERLTRRRSRLTALGSCGESPYDAAVRCCGRCGSCDTVTRGCTQWSARGRRALLNDFARQGNPSGRSASQTSLDCQGGGRREELGSSTSTASSTTPLVDMLSRLDRYPVPAQLDLSIVVRRPL
jgi:hypothetical protein